MCSRSCGRDLDFRSPASKWWDEGAYYRPWRTKYTYIRNTYRHRSDYRWYAGSSYPFRFWSDQKRSGAHSIREVDCGWTYSSGQNWGDGWEGAEGSRKHDPWRRRDSYIRGWYPRASSGNGASAWTYEIQNELRAECAEAFHRSSTACRAFGGRDRRWCKNCKACRIITWYWEISWPRDGRLTYSDRCGYL